MSDSAAYRTDKEGTGTEKKPVLVIMAAGMGSRYGGLKQIEPVDEQGHIIMDFSLFDARRAGFEKAVFIIKEENEQIFRERIGERVEKQMHTAYAFQKTEDLPDGFTVPEGRVKPWGTGHAVLSAAAEINGPFCVINADDYYGPEAFKLIYQYLTQHSDDDKYRYAMVGYVLKNTVTDNGHVARGICAVREDGTLEGLTERTMIIRTEEGTAYSEDEGKTWTDLDPESLVSMNMWGFTESFMKELTLQFPLFLQKALKENPLKAEYYLPFAVDELIREEKASVCVLRTEDKWYGMTYKEDRQIVIDAIKEMKKEGLYPEDF